MRSRVQQSCAQSIKLPPCTAAILSWSHWHASTGLHGSLRSRAELCLSRHRTNAKAYAKRSNSNSRHDFLLLHDSLLLNLSFMFIYLHNYAYFLESLPI